MADNPWRVSAVGFAVWWTWLYVPLNLIAEKFQKFAKRRSELIGEDRLIKGLLDHFHDATCDGAVQADFRVTLFRYVPISWRSKCGHWFYSRFSKNAKEPAWTGFLTSYDRSKAFRLKSKTRWGISFDDPRRNEGFAGKIFAEQTSQHIAGIVLPEGTGFKGKRRDYIRLTNSPEAWLDRKLDEGHCDQLPRSLWGIHLEVDNTGKAWGVLLVDSRLETIKNQRVLDGEAVFVLKMLKMILTSNN